MFKSIKERIQYLHMCIKDINELDNVDQDIFALKKDNGSLRKQKNHYSFDNMAQNDFTDFVMEKIGSALKQSKKATGITLSHSYATDKGMQSFIRGLSETKAPIREIHIDDFPYITDKSMKLLPEVIAKKGITVCDIGYCPNVSPELKKQIGLACIKNQQIMNTTAKSLSN